MTTEEYAFFLAYGVADDAELQQQELNEQMQLIPKVQTLDPYVDPYEVLPAKAA